MLQVWVRRLGRGRSNLRLHPLQGLPLHAPLKVHGLRLLLLLLLGLAGVVVACLLLLPHGLARLSAGLVAHAV